MLFDFSKNFYDFWLYVVCPHLDDILEDGGAEPAGDAGGGAQGGAGVDLQQPGPEVRGQHEVRTVQLVTVLTRAAPIHHVWGEYCQGRAQLQINPQDSEISQSF